MSADNWTICPKCMERAKGLRDAFKEKYYGKLDSETFIKIFQEVQRAVEHIESYSDEEFKPDIDILELAVKKGISVKYIGEDYDCYEILQENKVSASLREDYELGVNKKGLFYVIYTCSCECGFEKEYSYKEKQNEEK